MNVTNEVNMDLVVDVTENEAAALILCLNYNSIEDQLSDNYSNGGTEEFCKALGWTKHQVAGLIGSLEKKGLGELDSNDGNGDIFWLSEKGVHTAFHQSEKSKQKKEPEINLDELTSMAVKAALQVIDIATDGKTQNPMGPCGDKLATSLHDIIESALREELGRVEE